MEFAKRVRVRVRVRVRRKKHRILLYDTYKIVQLSKNLSTRRWYNGDTFMPSILSVSSYVRGVTNLVF